MITSSRFSAARLLMLALTVVVGAALGAIVAWLYTAVRSGDYRAFWILYVIALSALAIAVLTGRRELQRARAELARRRASSPYARPRL